MVEFLPELSFGKQVETVLQKEELYHLLVESLNGYAIILLDTHGKVLTWSAAAQKLEGFRRDEIVGKHFAVFYRREDIRQGRPLALLDEASANGSVEEEGWRLRKDGSRFWAHVVITALRDQDGRLRGFGKIVSDATHRKQAEGTLRKFTESLDQRVQERSSQLAQANWELRDSLAQLRALAARLQEVREDERASMAREVHDELGQALTALKMDLFWLMQRLPAAEKPLQQKGNSMLKLIDDTIFSVRRIAAALRPGMLDDLGLSAAIEWQAQEFQGRTGIECKLCLPPENVVLDDERSTAVFRIFQETLTNIARHAAATSMVVKMKKNGQELILEVVDNGKGFDMEAVGNKKSLGLLGMRERALLLGGKFEVCGKPGEGTSVTVRVPLKGREKKGGVKG